MGLPLPGSDLSQTLSSVFFVLAPFFDWNSPYGAKMDAMASASYFVNPSSIVPGDL